VRPRHEQGFFLNRLEKVEKRMNPPAPVPLPRIQLVFVRPDGTVAGRKIINPGPENDIEEMEDDETD
jgi:hypothetical protein